MTRSLLKQKCLPHNFWGEVVTTAAYLLNKWPMILVSYHPTSAYRLYNPVKQKTKVSKDVIVCEVDSWNWQDGASSSQNPSV